MSRKKSFSQVEQEAAKLLDFFYTKLRAWALRRRKNVRTLPTWQDIVAARTLARMNVSKDELYDAISLYFENLDVLLEQKPAQPTFTHFLDENRRIISVLSRKESGTEGAKRCDILTANAVGAKILKRESKVQGSDMHEHD